MKNGEKPHHLTDLVLLPVESRSTPDVFRPPLPVAEIYAMNWLDTKPEIARPELPKPAISRSSMFFKIADKGIENDPFLERLSRLN